MKKIVIFLTFCFSLASAAEVLCLDYLGMCHGLVFANTTYPRPDVQVGLAVSVNAYDEAHMRRVVARVMADFVDNGFLPFWQSSRSGDLPDTFPGLPDLHFHDFRREFACEGFDGCQGDGRIMEAFTLGYRSDSLNASDAEAIKWFVRNETGGRIDCTLTKMCQEFDKTCRTTTLSILPPPTTAPAQPNFTKEYVVGAILIGTALVAGATVVYSLAKLMCPRRSQVADDEAELLPLVPRG